MGRYLDIVRRVEQRKPVAKLPKPPPEIIDMTLRVVQETVFLYRGAADIAPMELPPCPKCHTRQYRVGTELSFVCSSCNVARFETIAMEFRTVQ